MKNDIPEIGLYIFDDELIAMTSADSVPRTRVYRLPEVVVVPGRSSKLDKELNLDLCLNDNTPILRRKGGGCSVVQDPGNVVVSVAIPAPGIGQINYYFRLLTDRLIEILKSIGIDNIYSDGYSDLVVANRKVAGSCMYRRKDLLYFSVSILVDPRTDLMERYLKHPPREPRYREGRTHSEFVGGLINLANSPDPESFANILSGKLSSGVLHL
jgi:lipoate---protein ligase